MPFFRPMMIKGMAMLGLLAFMPSCDWLSRDQPDEAKGENERRLEREARLRRACASELTYDRLKEYAFDEAQRIRGGDGQMLDQVATASGVRMEEPLVKSRDEELNVTVCTGRFILELPPGAENAFDGERRLSAQVEYAAQAAVDGSGLVYQMSGAEPIIYRLATIGGLAPSAPVRTASAPPAPPPPDATPEPDARPAATTAPSSGTRTAPARPSYSCRHASTRTEIMVCAAPELAARDRHMASVYYAEMARADGATRRQLRQSRDRFLGLRERCRSEACVAEAYEDRVDEIMRIGAGD